MSGEDKGVRSGHTGDAPGHADGNVRVVLTAQSLFELGVCRGLQCKVVAVEAFVHEDDSGAAKEFREAVAEFGDVSLIGEPVEGVRHEDLFAREADTEQGGQDGFCACHRVGTSH